MSYFRTTLHADPAPKFPVSHRHRIITQEHPIPVRQHNTPAIIRQETRQCVLRIAFVFHGMLATTLAIAANEEPLPQPDIAAAAQNNPGESSDAQTDFSDAWFKRVDEVSASQPHWVAPLTTVTPLLKEFVEYGQTNETVGNGSHVTNYAGGVGGVGLHLIPTNSNEVYVGVPPYIVTSGPKSFQGWGDWPAFMIKQRLSSGNESNGDYVITAYLSGQAPLYVTPYSLDAYYITPTLGMGKGWGDFDVQATVGTSIPTSHMNILGTQLATNVALQYHLLQYVWPEIEYNDTRWYNGLRNGMHQLFVTPNLLLGPFPVGKREFVSFVVGYQKAQLPSPMLTPLTPLYNSSWIFVTRMFF